LAINKPENRERQDIEWFQQKLESLGALPLTPDNLRLAVGHIKWEEAEREARRGDSAAERRTGSEQKPEIICVAAVIVGEALRGGEQAGQVRATRVRKSFDR
jgi:hypothetical protein